MTWFAVGATIVWAVLLCLITVVQTLYMESIRLRSRVMLGNSCTTKDLS